MFKLKRGYFYAAILLIISIGFAIPGCGGGGNNGTLPVTNTNASIDSTPSVVTSTPTPVLTNVSVSGYIYAGNITTEDGETVPNINVLDIPACQADSSGNEPFVSQFADTIKSDYPEDWAKAEIQELYAQLNKTLSESKPLSEINGQVYSVYADSQSATPIPVSSDGHFDNTVLTGAADSNVKLEVALGEDSYAEVETIASSDNIISSDSTNAVLKSCPEKIFAFPGEIVIFKVYAEPGINLKSAGLKFTLNNSTIGCITQPTYLCVFGAHKYQVAYGCLYIKNGLNTPVDTTITAKTNNGLTLNIFTEVIKKTSSISGTVYTGGMPLVKGFVHSLGPKACCKLDSNGAYTLPKVFRGHGRAVIATWWTIDENGKKIRHREEKIIDFFNQDVTGFNFGVPPTPTPTSTPSATPTPRDPTSPMYDFPMSKVISQFNQWETQMGTASAIQNTVDWINNRNLEPLPPEEIKEARIDESDANNIWIYFSDGYGVCFNVEEPVPIGNISSQKYDKSSLLSNSQISNRINASSNVTTPGSSKILILAPFFYELEALVIDPDPVTFHYLDPNYLDPAEYNSNPESFINKFNDHLFPCKLADDLINNNYEVDRVLTRGQFATTSFVEVSDILEDISTKYVVITDTTIERAKKPLPNPNNPNVIQMGLLLTSVVDWSTNPPTQINTTYEEQFNIIAAHKGIVYDTYKDFYDTLKNAGLFEINIQYITPYIEVWPVQPPPPPTPQISKIHHLFIKPGYEKNMVTIDNYLHLSDYGIIYINTHGNSMAIMATNLYANDSNTRFWLGYHYKECYDPYNNPSGTWYITYKKFYNTNFIAKALSLTHNFFAQQTYNNSIIYMGSCTSYSNYLIKAFMDHGASVYLGNDNKSGTIWDQAFAYNFFNYMMYGKDITDSSQPMSASQAYDMITNKHSIPHLDNPDTFWDSSQNEVLQCRKGLIVKLNNDTYFPIPTNIWIQKK